MNANENPYQKARGMQLDVFTNGYKHLSFSVHISNAVFNLGPKY